MRLNVETTAWCALLVEEIVHSDVDVALALLAGL